MATAFADTSYFIALLDDRDNLHAKATALSETLLESMTSELVLVELLNHRAGFGEHVRGNTSSFVRSLCRAPNWRVVSLSTAQFQSALTLYERSIDKKWSLVDCASFIIMRQHQITDPLTHDRHFTQAGFRALLR